MLRVYPTQIVKNKTMTIKERNPKEGYNQMAKTERAFLDLLAQIGSNSHFSQVIGFFGSVQKVGEGVKKSI